MLTLCQRTAVARPELLHTKKVSHVHERQLIEDKAVLVKKLQEVDQQLTVEKERVDSVEKKIEEKLTRRQESLVAELQTHIAKQEENLRIYKTRAEQAEQTMRKKTEALKNRLEAITADYSSLKRRRNHEIEGFTNDILALRKQLKTLEKHILKYGPLEDKELLLLNIARETGSRAAKMSTDLSNLKAKVYATEKQVQSLAL
ncbi:uncharacterized protein BJ171DRAFT_503751 [Polychytrium aggregatum]|uniref:uncharacterized protein n=1 Tax=Polychytrium aggregatum TaxID=110093 RepID=UPI0022FDD81C|nr:uncharacterized protein BJ171DRAFT_503751 [Polychytrium aggregatum]KAI9204825.1 hypothetical protein BJ171DRAFT_503751 [Polychytrium aggregatum]